MRAEIADDRHGEVQDDVRVPLDDLAHVEGAEDRAARPLHCRVGEERWLGSYHLKNQCEETFLGAG